MAPLSPTSFPPKPNHRRELLVCRASERVHAPSTPTWLLPSPNHSKLLLACKPFAMLCAPAGPISFCQRESPSSLKLNLRHSPMRCPLLSVSLLLPSSKLTNVLLRHNAKTSYHQTHNKLLSNLPFIIGSNPSSPRLHPFSIKCSSTWLVSRTLARH